MRQRSPLIPLLLLVAGCVGPRVASQGHRKYPPRPPNCALTLLHTTAPPPSLPTWDDLGGAEVTCHLDVGSGECLRRFRAEACRMGGDLVYALPEKPIRPKEYAILFRGRVAHTRAAAERGDAGSLSPEAGAAPSFDTSPEAAPLPAP